MKAGVSLKDALAYAPAEITVQTIQHWFGCSRWTAWRWLSNIERDHGPGVIKRRRKRGIEELYTTRAALERVAQRMHVIFDPKIEKRLQLLESQVKEHDTRLDGQARDVVEFRRRSREWYKSKAGG